MSGRELDLLVEVPVRLLRILPVGVGVVAVGRPMVVR